MHFLPKLCLFSLYSRNRHRSYGQSIVSQNSLVDKVHVLLRCVRFQYNFKLAHYLVLILMHTQEKIFLQTFKFLLESRCVITIVSKEIGYTNYFFFLNIVLVSSFQYIPKLRNFLFKY